MRAAAHPVPPILPISTIPDDAPPRKTSPPRIVAAAVVALCFLAIAAEALLQILGLDYRSEYDRMLESWRAADGVIYEGRPGDYHFGGQDVHINSLGFRGPEPGARTPGTARLLALGDSTVFGYGVSHEDTWPAILERLLREQTGENVEVINLGKTGNSSLGVLADLDRFGDRLQPDALVIGVGAWNDYQILHHFPGADEKQAIGKGMFHREIDLANHPLRFSKLFQLWRAEHMMREMRVVAARQIDAIEKEGAYKYDAVDTVRRVSPDEYAANIDAICAWARERAIPVYFVAPRIRDNNERTYGIFRRYLEILRQRAEANDAIVAPTREAFMEAEKTTPAGEMWVDDVHAGPRGTEAVARGLAQVIVPDWHHVKEQP